MKNKYYFCSFGDSRMRVALRRIYNQAVEIGVFDEIKVYDENGLSPDFLNAHRSRLIKGSKGFGYWIWKPQIILQVINEMNENDCILFTDVGCHLNPCGAEVLKSYFNRVECSKSGMLFTKLQDHMLEKHWTKGDVFDHFSCRYTPDVTETPQYQSGIIFLQKRSQTIELIRNWAAACLVTGLVDDSPSKSPNFEGFQVHRHDQSILSVLGKLSGVETINVDKFLTYEDWSILKDQPILIMRDKGLKKGVIYRLFGSNIINYLILIRRKFFHR